MSVAIPLVPDATKETVQQPGEQEEGGNEVLEASRGLGGIAWVILVISLLSTTFLYALDNTIVANIRPSIVKSLGEIDKLPWVSVAYAVGEVGSNPFWGKMYGQFNSKALYLSAVFIFGVGSAICGSAPTANALIVGRTICGVGGSGIYVGTINILSILTTASKRALYLSFVGIAWCIGTVLGPIIGGAFADSQASWRWAFYINLCIAGAALPANVFLLPSSKPSNLPFMTRIKNIDFAGLILFVGATLTLIMAIAFGGAVFAWKSGQIIALFVLTICLWISFAVQQGRYFLTTRSNRAFPAQFITSYEMCIQFAEASAGIASVILPLYTIPLFYQFVRGYSALTAGVRTLPFICSGVVGVMVNGALFAKLNLYMPWFTVGGALLIIGGSLFTTITPHTTDSQIYGYSVLTGLGAGLFAQAPFAVAQAKVTPAEVSQISAFITCAQMAGVALSIDIGTSIFLNQATNKIAVILPNLSKATVQTSIEGSSVSFLQDVSPAQRLAILAAIASTIAHVFYTVVAAGALAIILSLFMKRERLKLD